MKKMFKRMVAALIAAVMLFSSAPIELLTGFDFSNLFRVEANAAEANWLWPVPSVKYLTKDRYFGWINKNFFHNGIDIPGNNLDVVASKSGSVLYVFSGCNLWSHGGSAQTCADAGICAPKRNGVPYYASSGGMCNHGFGRGVVIDHGDGTFSHYAHMSSVAVTHGQYVKQGDILGKTGAYGNAYGAHLHFTLASGGMWGVFNNTPNNLGNYPNAAISYIFSVETPVVYKNGVYKTNASNIRFRREPNTSSTIYAEMPKGTILEVTDVTDAGWGYCVYNGQSGWVALWHTEYVGKTMPKPKAPVLTAEKEGNVPVKSKIKLSWNAVDNANGYKVYINGEAVDNGINTSYLLDVSETKNYSVYVVAHNPKYTSEKSKTIDINGKPDCEVTFKDWNGNVLEEKTVKYGGNAISPDTPSREGYTFIGWDKPLNKIVENTVITATYKINKYTIKFLDYNDTLLSSQIVEYGSDATPPQVTTAPTGFEFFDWNSTEYLSVKGNATVKGIYVWSNEDLPIVAQITSAKRQEDGYYVYFDLTNYPTAITRGRAVVTLKTAEGKLVETTESAAFSIPAGATKKQMEVFIPCDESASKVEIVVVSSYSAGVPISEMAEAAVDQGLAWSDWADTEPAAGTYSEMESRKVYQYRDKEFTTASTYEKEGWTKYHSTWVWSDYGNWSAWSKTKSNDLHTASDSREVGTRVVTDAEGYTNYKYWIYVSNDHYYIGTKGYQGVCYNYEEINIRYPLSLVDANNGLYGYFTCPNKSHHNRWFDGGSYYVPPVTHTEYRYRLRSKIYTYYFYRWLEWSDWSPEPVTPTQDREVNSKTQYRYRNEFDDAGIEDTGGILRCASTDSSVLGENDICLPAFPEKAGKEITLFVYKVDEASDWTNEFVGQTVINPDGSYSFNFKLREEPSVKTGDFTVAIGVEGTTNTIVVGKIEAPKAQHTVVFRDWDGSIIETQIVEEGKSAIPPEVNPAREGYDFVGWSSSVSNILSDMDIEARFIKKVYTVVFVDWTTETIVTKQFEHGDLLTAPDVEKTEGYTLVGWSGVTEGETVVTENMIVTAQYDAETYEVNIYDFEMNIIGTQTVKHGDYAELPDELEKSKYIFLGWEDVNNNNTSSVTSDLEVYPVFIFEDTVENPVASVRTGTYTENQLVELSCATEDAVIHYTTDGTDPLNSLTAKLYEGPIELTRSVELKFVASAFEMNDSETVSEYYAINTDTSTSSWVAYDELPDYILAKPSDYSLESDIGYKYKNVIVTSRASEIETLEKDGWTNEGFEYSEQSSWSVTYPELEDTVYEVIEQKPPLVEEARYEYSHFKYLNPEDGTYSYSPEAIEGVDGVTETYVSPTKLQITNFIPDTTTPYYTYNGEMWFNQTPITVSVDPGYMMYAYKLKNYTFTKWTDWSVEAPAEDESRETVSETVYCYTHPEMCIVTFVDGFEEAEIVSKLAIVDRSLSGINTDELARNGYAVDGLYTDSDYTNEWNIESDILSGNITLYVKQSIKTFTVTFLDSNGNVLDTQTVEYGGKATPPEVETQNGYVFVGWDSDSYMFAADDTEIKAIVKHESEIAKVTLNRSKFRTTVGSAFSLTATVAPETLPDKSVTWSSSDSSVADVNSEGIVFAISSGTATITATAFDGTSASCIVTVIGDPDSELSLVSSSELVVDSSGYLRNIPIITDESMGTHTAETVADIKKEFTNESVVIVDMNGKTLSDEESVGTGSVVMLMDGDSVIDSIIIIITGDYDGDGEITNRDAARISRFTVDKESPNLYQNLAMDVNGDGYVNNRDASMISRYLVGKETI